jgi:hypothetical protein
MYKKHAPEQLHRFDSILEKYKGRERDLYTELLVYHVGSARAQKFASSLPQLSCRICHETGHWGNECPQRASSATKYRKIKTELTDALTPGDATDEESLPDFDRDEHLRIGLFPTDVKEEEKGNETETSSSDKHVLIPKAPRPSKVSQPELYLDAPWRLQKKKSMQTVSSPRLKRSNVQVEKHKSKPFRHR